MINSIDAEKEFDNIQHHFMINTLIKVDIEETYLNIKVAVYDKSKANIILTNEKNESLPAKFWNKTRRATLTKTIQYSIGSPTTEIRQ